MAENHELDQTEEQLLLKKYYYIATEGSRTVARYGRNELNLYEKHSWGKMKECLSLTPALTSPNWPLAVPSNGFFWLLQPRFVINRLRVCCDNCWELVHFSQLPSNIFPRIYPNVCLVHAVNDIHAHARPSHMNAACAVEYSTAYTSQTTLQTLAFLSWLCRP